MLAGLDDVGMLKAGPVAMRFLVRIEEFPITARLNAKSNCVVCGHVSLRSPRAKSCACTRSGATDARRGDNQTAAQGGKIGFAAAINPDLVVICHCSDCQIISGAPYRANVPVKRENFELSGEPKSCVKTAVKTAASGRKVALAFCGDCGSALYSTRLVNPDLLYLRLGWVKERAELMPKLQGWCSFAMP
jgi:hypothetical protein